MRTEMGGNWGEQDEVVLRKENEIFMTMGRKKFFSVILTVSNHPPYDMPRERCTFLPGDDDETKRINGFRYADWALGEFFKVARESPYFERTIFVLVADHGRYCDQRQILDLPSYRIPFLIYAPGIVSPGKSDIVASQTDIAPTVLALLGGRFEHCFLGRNLLSVEDGQGFALLHEDYGLGFIRRHRVP